jgi:hypothetical protein
MTLHDPKLDSIALRRSLKRGLARQAWAQAEEGDLARVVQMSRDLAPNAKARDRLALRVQALRGVVRVGLAGDEVVAVLRHRRQVTMRTEGADLFTEGALFYTRIAIRAGRGSTGYRLTRASFCLHALERLVERSPVALDRPLLAAVDAEAVAVLRGCVRADLIADGEDHFARATGQGLWAGSLDQSEMDADWDLTYARPDAQVPVFSARTYLAPDQMRPTLWARWQGDPCLRMM